MDIIVFGGAGDMGSRAVEELATTPGVNRVTIADRNLAQAGRIAADLEGKGAEIVVKPVDAHQHQSLVEAMQGHDVAASALGPFHLFETKLVEAAIEAGVSYASICDEWEPARQVIERFDEPARRAGVTVVTGLGTSPGYTNVGVRLLADRLDQVRRADLCVYQPLAGGGGPAVLAHMMFIMDGQVSVFHEGRQQSVPALSDGHEVEFPRFGPIRVWRMGHSEPETVPRFLPGIEEVNFFMGYGRGASFLVGPARLGLFGGPLRRRLAVRFITGLERLTRPSQPAQGAVRIDVWGEKDGQEQHHLLCGIGEMRQATGISLAIGALMLARKELLVATGGVFAPEACIQPKAFISAMREKGIFAYEDLEMTRELV